MTFDCPIFGQVCSYKQEGIDTEEEENEKESRKPDYDEDKDQLEERQGELAQGKQKSIKFSD